MFAAIQATNKPILNHAMTMVVTKVITNGYRSGANTKTTIASTQSV